MRTRILVATLAVVVIVAVVSSCTVSAAKSSKLEMEEEHVPIPTEAQVKKMKVRELQAFLSDRGVACDACTEKGDYVKKVVANLQTPLLQSKRKLKPKGEFYEFWASVAKTTCEEGAKKKSADGEFCDQLAGAVDSFFMQHGKRTAAKLKKKPAALLKTSVTEPYQGAVRRMFGKLVSYCLKNKGACGSMSKVSTLLESNKVKGVDFTKWITNVGIENTNPMYEALKDKALNSDL